MENILIEFKETNAPFGTSIITINRPKALNALNMETLKELKEAVETESAKKEVRTIIITGAGEKAFVAGADIAEMSDFNKEQAIAFSKIGNDTFNAIAQAQVPVIAAVNGFALGGGMELSMACDFRLSSENASFALPEVSLGLIPGFAGTQRASRLLGQGIASEMIFTGAMIDATRAKEIGLVNNVYTSEELMDQALKIASKINKQAPIAVSSTKKLINQGLDVSLEKGIDLEAQAFGSIFETKDAKEGTKAFINKEKYAYQGE